MIRNNIDNLIAEAMKSKEQSKLKVLRLIKAEFQKFKTSSREVTFDDAAELNILKKLQKQWKEEQEAFANANRDISVLTLELEYLESFIPKAPSVEEQKEITTKVIEKYLSDLPIEERASMKHLGPIIGILNKEYPYIEKKLVSNFYKELIGLK